MREKELKAAKAQLQKREGNATRAAEAEAALATAKAEVGRALTQHPTAFGTLPGVIGSTRCSAFMPISRR